QGLRVFPDHPPVQGARVPGGGVRLAGGGSAKAVQRAGRVAGGWRLSLERALRAAGSHQELRLLAAVLHGILARAELAGSGGTGTSRPWPGQVAIKVL